MSQGVILSKKGLKYTAESSETMQSHWTITRENKITDELFLLNIWIG
jgi:hypothetical protein